MVLQGLKPLFPIAIGKKRKKEEKRANDQPWNEAPWCNLSTCDGQNSFTLAYQTPFQTFSDMYGLHFNIFYVLILYYMKTKSTCQPIKDSIEARTSKQGGLHGLGRPYLLRKVYIVG